MKIQSPLSSGACYVNDCVLIVSFFISIRETEEKPGWCSDPHLPPCAA